MKEYKLLKDIKISKKNCIFKYGEDIIGIHGIENLEIGNCGEIKQLIDLFGIDNKEWFEEIKKETTIFEIEELDDIYYINDNGEIDISAYQEGCIKYINAFVTKKEAIRERVKLKAIYNIKKYCYENNIEINKEGYTYIIGYSTNSKNYYYDELSYRIQTEFLFKNGTDTKIIINNCKEDLDVLFNIK